MQPVASHTLCPLLCGMVYVAYKSTRVYNDVTERPFGARPNAQPTIECGCGFKQRQLLQVTSDKLQNRHRKQNTCKINQNKVAFLNTTFN